MGLEVAGAILELGGDVVCVDRAAEPLQDLWSKVQSKAQRCDTKIWYYPCDITKPDEVDAVFEKSLSLARFPLRGLVACAAVSGGGWSIDFPLDQARRIIDVNLLGAFACCQAAGRVFQKQACSGSVVLVASMSGYGSNKGVDTAAYNSSKAAVIQLARSLAAEWGSRVEMPCVRVNSLCPGYMKTRMTQVDLEDPSCEQAWSADNMLNRLSYADEYRGAVVYLLSDASSFVTGSDLRVDGGHTAW